ncbi:jerky protein homolog-like [Frieseomelitta varia]|uniref:jerky protein homolog-like n=1 Tax=Frieseomelitta varia TaxID=561572 RepID=UPI001CB67AA9|nr:jerky protein homolog-like [Frieseomelitta varia]
MADSKSSKEVNIADRLDILNKLEAGENINTLAREYNVSNRTIRRIRQKALSIRRYAKEDFKLQKKRMRTSISADLDKELYSWFLQRRSAGDRITDYILIEKARALQEERGGPSNFTLCKGWLWRFKRNYNLRPTNVPYGESDNTDKSVAKEFVQQFLQMLEDNEISDNNLYNVDETSLFWKMLPKEILMSKNESRVSEKNIKKDRITLALCANASGNHKLPLFVINNCENPRALKHCMNNLPVIYTHNKNAWMNTAVFQLWYHNEFKPRVRRRQLEENSGGKVLLIIDNFSGHKLSEKEMDDGHFKIIFLPPNTSSLIQPMDQGIISKLKKKFRHKLLQRVLLYENGISEFYADYDIKDCIDMTNETWSVITSANIFNSWNKILNREAGIAERNFTCSVAFSSETAPCDATYETISDDKVTEWINECGEAERIREDATEETDATEESSHSQHLANPIEVEEVDRLLYYLQKIIATEPEIPSHAKSIIDYYNSK